MSVRSKVIWTLNHASEQRTLRKIELPQIFTKVSLRSLTEPVNRERTSLPRIDLVRLHLNDLFLIEASLKLKGDHDLGDLSRVGLLGR